MNFERGQDPRHTLKIGQRALIDEWFERWATMSKYTVNENLNIKVFDNLYFISYKVTFLPNNLSVEGNLNLCNNTQLTSLPDNLTVRGWLDINGTSISSLPDSLKVGGKIYKDF